MSVHTRTKGHSAVAAAAYRSASRLTDERTGEVHDYTKRKDVVYTKIMLPIGADKALLAREHLWNLAEAAERRKDSQVSKDIILALPRELDLDQQIALACQFADDHFVSQGLAVDVAIHDHGDGNPHAHLLLTTRRVVGDRFDVKKARDLNPSFANVFGQNKGFVALEDAWGPAWRESQDRFFVEHNIDLKVDANYIVPQRHEGRVRGQEKHYLQEENELRKDASISIALNEPLSLLNVIASQYAVFSDRDIARVISKNTTTAEEFEAALIKVRAHEDVIKLGPGDDGRDRYTTRSNYEREARLGDTANTLNLEKSHAVTEKHIQDAIRDFSLTDEQASALKHIAAPQAISAIVGRAGTGKSYLMGAARQMWEANGYEVQGMAMAGVAAKGLEDSAKISSHTIAYYLHRLKHNKWHLDEKSIVVMDEAGMTDLNDMYDVLTAIHNAKAKLVLIGDPDQLQPVGLGASFRALLERIGFAEMQTIQRQNDPGDRQATTLLSKGEVGEAIEHYYRKGQVTFGENFDDTISALIKDWGRDVSLDNLADRVILSFENNAVDSLNFEARSVLIQKGILGRESISIQTPRGTLVVNTNDRLLFRKNDKALNVFNGDIGHVIAVSDRQITVKVSDKTLTFSPDQYNHLSYGYAATVHKSQGATYKNVFVAALGFGWNRVLSYVALSRHKDRVHLYADQSEFKDMAQLKDSMGRATFKDSVLDFPLSYAIRRGFDPDTEAQEFIQRHKTWKEKIYDKWLFITNYEAYCLKKKREQTLNARQIRRQEAVKIAALADLHRAIGKSFSEMGENLNQDQKLSDHPQYLNTYRDMIRRNRLASEIADSPDRYTQAMALNRLDLDTIKRYRDKHDQYETAKNYFAALLNGDLKVCENLSEILSNDYKSYYGYFHYLLRDAKTLGFSATSIQRILPKKAVYQIKDNIDEQRFKRQFQQAYLQANDVERHALKTVKDYHQVEKLLRQTWSSVYQLGGVDKLSTDQMRQYQARSARADQLASLICAAPNKYSEALHLFDINIEKLTASHVKHMARETVRDYSDATDTMTREALATEILSDKRYYTHVYEFDLDWKELNTDHKNYKDSVILGKLKTVEQKNYYFFNDYIESRIEVAKAWGAFIKDKTSDPGSITKERQEECWLLTQKRNQLAYQIALHPERYNDFVADSQLKLSDLEKHALSYQKQLQRDKDKRDKRQHNKNSGVIQTHNIKDTPAFNVKTNQWHYGIVNDALIAMGERFYERVLGFEGKREGTSIAYRQSHALLYSPQGDKAGSWHSFSTGEGGGPLQLLMSHTHGWGLSYKEALKSGASLAGLSEEQIVPYFPQTPPKTVKSTDHSTNIQKRISSARYYYESAQNIEGTLGERYLREHRKISGDISFVRFHPRIRDAKTIKRPDGTTKKEINYYPGIVVAARNEQGELTGSQTILLNPQTAQKMSKDKVGAVKRSRGIIKGSAVCIQKTDSKQVVIVEGNETALSLTGALPKANIYVTLGNIKNAESLHWLAKKHGTKALHFAADNDGENQKNIQAIHEIAKTLKHEHQIDCYISKPHLEKDQKKADFNDVLQNKGLNNVKREVNAWDQVMVPEKEVFVTPETIQETIKSQFIGTKPETESKPSKLEKADKLKILSDEISKLPANKLISEYQKTVATRSKNETPDETKLYHAKLNHIAMRITEDKDLNARIKRDNPKAAEVILKRCELYHSEIDKNNQFDRSLKLYKSTILELKKSNSVNDTNKLYSRLDRLSLKLVKNKDRFSELKAKSPKLAKVINERAQHNRGKDLDLDR